MQTILAVLSMLFGCYSSKKFYYSIDNQTPDDWRFALFDTGVPTFDHMKQTLTNTYVAKASLHVYWNVDLEPRTDGLPHLFTLMLKTPSTSTSNVKEAVIFPVYSQHESTECHSVTDQLLHVLTPNSTMITKIYQCGMRIWMVPAIRTNSDKLININETLAPKKRQDEALPVNQTEPIWLKSKKGICLHRKESCKIEWHIVGIHDNREMEDEGEFVFEITIGLTEGRSLEKTTEQKNQSHSQHNIKGSLEIGPEIVKVGFEYAHEWGSGTEETKGQTDVTSRDVTRTHTQQFKYTVGAEKKMIAEQEVLNCDCFGYETAHVRAKTSTRSKDSVIFSWIVFIVVTFILLCLSFCLSKPGQRARFWLLSTFSE